MQLQRVSWSALALSTCFVLLRAWAHWKTFRRFFLDDFFVLLTWIIVLVSAILWYFAAPSLFEAVDVTSGRLSVTQAPNLMHDVVYFARTALIINILFYAGLWSIKMSFLIYFRRILVGTHYRRLYTHWWVVFTLTIVTWVICIGDLPYDCFVNSFRNLNGRCSTPEATQKQRILLGINTALDVLTDILSKCGKIP